MISDDQQVGWVTLHDAAHDLHICSRQLHTYRRRFQLKSKKIGRSVYVCVKEIEDLQLRINPCGRPSKTGRRLRLSMRAYAIHMFKSTILWIDLVIDGYLTWDVATIRERAALRPMRAVLAAFLDAFEDKDDPDALRDALKKISYGDESAMDTFRHCVYFCTDLLEALERPSPDPTS